MNFCRKQVMQDMYKDENMKEFNNPLDWWRINEKQFPLIAKMAKRYLAIPATSAPSERVWSLSAFVIHANVQGLILTWYQK